MKNVRERRILLHLFLPRERYELVGAAECAKPPEEISSCQESCKIHTLLIIAELLVASCFFSQKRSGADSTDTGFFSLTTSFQTACFISAFPSDKEHLRSLRPVLRDRHAGLSRCLLTLGVAVLFS